MSLLLLKILNVLANFIFFNFIGHAHILSLALSSYFYGKEWWNTDFSQ